MDNRYKRGTETDFKIFKPIEKGIIVELPDVVDSFIPASQLATGPIRNFNELFKTGDKLNAEVIEFDKNNKKIVLSVIEYLKDKEQSDIDAYIDRFKLPKKFTVQDVQEKTRSFEQEQVDFRIEDIIGEDVPEVNHPPKEEQPKAEEKKTEAKAEKKVEEVKEEIKEDATPSLEEKAVETHDVKDSETKDEEKKEDSEKSSEEEVEEKTEENK